MDKFEEAWKENRHVWESTKNLAKAMYLAGQQSRQAEVDQLKGLLEKDEYAHSLYYENENLKAGLEEKDKRVEELQAKVDAVEHVLGCAMIAPKEVFQYADRIGRALRGEHE